MSGLISYVGALGGYDDHTAEFAACLAAAAGGQVIVLPGRYRIEGPLSIPANTQVVAYGAAEIQVPAGSSFRVFDIDGVSGVSIRGRFRFTKASGAALTGTAYAVSIRGSASDVLVEGIEATAFRRGIDVAGGEGTTPGTCRRITLRKCRADGSPSEYGINIDDSDDVLIDDCHASGNWLDGVKLRKMAHNVEVRGGSYNDNGASGLGDGMDAYAGGDRFVVAHTIFEGNAENGLTIKTGELTVSDPGIYGYVRRAQLIGLRCKGNGGIGVYVTVSEQLDLTQPVPTNILILGGMCEENGTRGWYLNARNITAIGPVAKKNQGHGIMVAQRAFDVETVSPQCIANSQSAAGSFDGVFIEDATRIVVRGGLFIGVDADAVATDADYSALTKYQGRAIRVNADCSEIVLEVEGAIAAYHTATVPFRTDMTSGVCLIHQNKVDAPSGAGGAYGSIGSRCTQTNAASGAAVWTKTSGAPNAPTSGWTKTMTPLRASQSAVNPASLANGAQQTIATVTVTGASLGDAVQVAFSLSLQGTRIWGEVTAADTVTVYQSNQTGAAVDVGSGTVQVWVVKN